VSMWVHTKLITQTYMYVFFASLRIKKHKFFVPPPTLKSNFKLTTLWTKMVDAFLWTNLQNVLGFWNLTYSMVKIWHAIILRVKIYTSFDLTTEQRTTQSYLMCLVITFHLKSNLDRKLFPKLNFLCVSLGTCWRNR
jgi:hypothetical protein